MPLSRTHPLRCFVDCRTAHFAPPALRVPQAMDATLVGARWVVAVRLVPSGLACLLRAVRARTRSGVEALRSVFFLKICVVPWGSAESKATARQRNRTVHVTAAGCFWRVQDVPRDLTFRAEHRV